MSGGWLDRFKNRHRILLKAVSGEAASAKRVNMTGWEAKLQAILRDFLPRDILPTRQDFSIRASQINHLLFREKLAWVKKCQRISSYCYLLQTWKAKGCYSWQLESMKSQGALKTSINCLRPIASIKRLGCPANYLKNGFENLTGSFSYKAAPLP